MNWIEGLNKAITYMEEHMTGEINYAKVAQIACCSSYHFQRMFSYLADVPLSEYIRRRKMSLAAVDLQSENAKVIDVALKYGYSSPTSFNRTFQSIHGVAPSRIKDDGVSIKSYPPISFKITVKGVQEMNFRIEKKDSFRIVGVSQPLAKDYEECVKISTKMWEQAVMDGTMQKLSELLNNAPKGILGVNVCCDKQRATTYNEDWRYFIAVPSTLERGEFEEYEVPALTWAIFPNKGDFSKELPELLRRVITEWLPNSGYEYANGPDIELLLPTNDIENAEFEVWIPVRIKE
jgi:AraC family transcriptional regulator